MAASQKKHMCNHIYVIIYIYERKCNHSNIHGSTLVNNSIIIILSTLNTDLLIENMARTILERRDKVFCVYVRRGESKRAYFLPFISDYEHVMSTIEKLSNST